MTGNAGCLCGAVRIEVGGDPLRVRTCWCRDCQYWGSGNGTTNAFYPLDALEIRGEVHWFESAADSGNRMRRGFCPACGTPLFTGPAVEPKLLGIRAGAFDDPDSVRPTALIWTGSAPDWACLDPSLPHSEGQPPPVG